jgi:hypothetical protein
MGWRSVPGGGDGGSGWIGSGVAVRVDGGRCGRRCAPAGVWPTQVLFGGGSTWRGRQRTAG